MRVIGYQLLLQKKATKEYKILLHNNDFLEKSKEFDVKSQRVDDFFATIFSKGKSYEDLWFVAKKVFLIKGNFESKCQQGNDDSSSKV